MKFLLKLFCLLSLLSSFLFANLKIYSDENLKGYYFKSIDMKFLKGNNLLGFRDSSGYHIYPFTFDHSYYSGSKYSPGFYWGAGNFVYFVGDVVSNHLYVEMNTWSYTVYSISDNPSHPFLTYSSLLFFRLGDSLATCSANQEFNTETNKCVDPCPAGHFWNVNTNSCVVDCSDEDNHKFFTNDYRCIDCSSALTADDIARCYCIGLGSSYNPGFAWDPDKPNILHAHCSNETEISFKFDKDKMKDKDNNSTNSSDKDKENPKPDKDKDNSNPDKKDNNENSNNSSGESGNPSNNNSGGSAGNGSSGGGGTGVETKPNPNNGNGKQDGKGEEGKGDDNIGPANLDYEGLKASADTFEGQFKTAIDDSFSFVNDVKASLMDTIQKIKDGNLMSLKKGAVPTTCPLSFDVNFVFSNKQITFDLCKVFSSVSSSLYILFYLAFFILFLVVTIKLFILTFMGW
ncbi:hypothetical protein [Campylobacter concisus]|uniref:Membrane protein n=1 Tax=Campylobacter concisus (strain 13826) TaxID=360104 RepID=A7ZDE3_CAMC1|nr:hypothetical protein [Campylobacter concisus]EAT98687.3 putative membrane protein [Campylobacter concisus 13826]